MNKIFMDTTTQPALLTHSICSSLRCQHTKPLDTSENANVTKQKLNMK